MTVGPLAGGRGRFTELLPGEDARPCLNGRHVKLIDEADDPAVRAVAGDVIESLDLSGFVRFNVSAGGPDG